MLTLPWVRAPAAGWPAGAPVTLGRDTRTVAADPPGGTLLAAAHAPGLRHPATPATTPQTRRRRTRPGEPQPRPAR
jgi:hypothetical protein